MNPTPNFRSRLLAGEPLLGILLTLPVPAIAEICADAGFDWLFLDMEHGSLDLHDVEAIAQVVNDRCPCVVRVPINDRMWIGKVLDLGVAGIIVPQVNNAEQARRAVFAAQYPRAGGRGVGGGRAFGYGAHSKAYLAHANEDAAVIAQIEHEDALPNVREIAGVPGIDALMIGPNDLAASMGYLGDTGHARVQEAIARVHEVGARMGKRMSLFCTDGAQARRAFADGYTLVPVATDTLLLVRAAQSLVRTARGESEPE